MSHTCTPQLWCAGQVKQRRKTRKLPEASEFDVEASKMAELFGEPLSAHWMGIYDLDDEQLRNKINQCTSEHIAVVIDPIRGVSVMPLVAAMKLLRNSESSRVNLWGSNDLWFSVDCEAFAAFENRTIGDAHRNQPAKAVLYPPPSKAALRAGARDTMDSRQDIYGPVVFYKADAGADSE